MKICGFIYTNHYWHGKLLKGMHIAAVNIKQAFHHEREELLMAFEKIRIPRKIVSFMKDVVVDVISNQINKRKETKTVDVQPIQFSSIEFEREMRSRVSELEDQMINIEAVIAQGKCLYESVIKSLPTSVSPTTQIEGDVTINVNIYYFEGGVQFVGQNYILNAEKLKELVDSEAQNRFIIDEKEIVEENASSGSLINKNTLAEKFYKIVKEQRG